MKLNLSYINLFYVYTTFVSKSLVGRPKVSNWYTTLWTVGNDTFHAKNEWYLSKCPNTVFYKVSALPILSKIQMFYAKFPTYLKVEVRENIVSGEASGGSEDT